MKYTGLNSLEFYKSISLISFLTLITFFNIASCNLMPESKVVSDTDAALTMTDDSLFYYQGNLFSGTIVAYHSNDNLKYSREYKEGKEDGTQKGFHFNGNLSYQYTSIKGKWQGEYQEYFPSGDIQIYKIYEDGKAIKTRIRDINGKVLANYVWKNNRYFGYLGSSTCISVLNEIEE